MISLAPNQPLLLTPLIHTWHEIIKQHTYYATVSQNQVDQGWKDCFIDVTFKRYDFFKNDKYQNQNITWKDLKSVHMEIKAKKSSRVT